MTMVRCTNRAAPVWAACRTLLAGAAVIVPVPATGQGQIYRYQELYSFRSEADGYSPRGAVVQGSDGNFYGTTYEGGQPTTNCPTCGYGTVFGITPEGALTTLAWFDGRAGLTNGEGITNFGGYPFGSMVQATDGNFHGSSEYGGFVVTPNGVLTSGTGGGDVGDPMQGTNGYLYGADAYYGVVSWASLDDSYYTEVAAPGSPSGGLIQASDGNFYGLTSNGGAYGYGTAYKLTPGGALSTLATFGGGGNNSRWPYGKMLQASDGNLYGVCDSPEQIFKLTLSGTLTTFAVFGTNGDLGYNPNGGLIEANDGNLYGTTIEGGQIGGAEGTVFKITPQGRITTLFVFSTRGAVPGSGPLAGLIKGSDGNLYGNCAYGGTYGGGSIFRIVMPGPELRASRVGARLVLSWRTNYTGFSLQSAAAPASTNWLDCTNLPSVAGGQFFVTNPISASPQFFRLKK